MPDPRPIGRPKPEEPQPCAVTSLECSINQAHIAGLMLQDLSAQVAERCAHKPEEVQQKAYAKAWGKLTESERAGLAPPVGGKAV